MSPEYLISTLFLLSFLVFTIHRFPNSIIFFFVNAPKFTDGIKSGLGESLLNPFRKEVPGHSQLPATGVEKARHVFIPFFGCRLSVPLEGDDLAHAGQNLQRILLRGQAQAVADGVNMLNAYSEPSCRTVKNFLTVAAGSNSPAS
jgi:hypothetical protein